MKIKVERQIAPDKWISQDCELKSSHRGNCYFMLSGVIYVSRDMQPGSTVVTKDKSGQWVPVGRVAKGSIFLGEGLTYQEFCETPEGKQKLKEMLQSLQKWRVERCTEAMTM